MAGTGALGEALLDQYLAVHPGFQRLAFAGGRVGLTLLLGDALECLPQLDARVDAWFLDGFAPAKNPDMWSPALFAELARLSAPQATLGTFTSAGFVRRGLIEAGFAMQRVPGYGQKREMLGGTYQGPPANAGKPWYARPRPRRAPRGTGGRRRPGRLRQRRQPRRARLAGDPDRTPSRPRPGSLGNPRACST